MPCNCYKYYSKKNTSDLTIPKSLPSLPKPKPTVTFSRSKVNSSFTTYKSVIPGFKRPH